MIEVVLTDVEMPRFDGVALTRALKHINPVLPIIATSGMVDAGRLEALQDLGAHAFLLKPYPLAELLSVLNDAITSPPKFMERVSKVFRRLGSNSGLFGHEELVPVS